MSADPLTPEVSARICAHMNDDHAEAVLAYARHYGGIDSPSQASMLEVQANGMLLNVDGRELHIPFDHALSDSEDAHRTLVAMLRAMPRTED
jgi:putative heme iron utilization protein